MEWIVDARKFSQQSGEFVSAMSMLMRVVVNIQLSDLLLPLEQIAGLRAGSNYLDRISLPLMVLRLLSCAIRTLQYYNILEYSHYRVVVV